MVTTIVPLTSIIYPFEETTEASSVYTVFYMLYDLTYIWNLIKKSNPEKQNKNVVIRSWGGRGGRDWRMLIKGYELSAIRCVSSGDPTVF